MACCRRPFQFFPPGSGMWLACRPFGNIKRKDKPMFQRCLLVVVFAALLTGCSKLTQTNYEKLKVGMGYDEVVKILGKPDKCSGALFAKNCTWGSGEKFITASFVGDKIVVYASKNLK
jgi:hypothetical protein